MKKAILILVLFISALGSKAQQIDSIVMIPAMPDANDPITFYIYLSFPQGSCADVATVFTSGNDIYGYGFHCMGNAMFICNDVDTVSSAPLAAGNYNFYFTLDAGYGPPGNCSAGFQPYDVDTVPFAVTTILDVPVEQSPMITLFPNPASDHLKVIISGGTIAKMQVMNLLGEEVFASQPNATSAEIPVIILAEGLYVCRVTDAFENVYLRQVEIVR